MTDYTMKLGAYCDVCSKNAEDWPGKAGVVMKTDYGRNVVYCKDCFKQWLTTEDEMEMEVADWEEF